MVSSGNPHTGGATLEGTKVPGRFSAADDDLNTMPIGIEPETPHLCRVPPPLRPLLTYETFSWRRDDFWPCKSMLQPGPILILKMSLANEICCYLERESCCLADHYGEQIFTMSTDAFQSYRSIFNARSCLHKTGSYRRLWVLFQSDVIGTAAQNRVPFGPGHLRGIEKVIMFLQ